MQNHIFLIKLLFLGMAYSQKNRLCYLSGCKRSNELCQSLGYCLFCHFKVTLHALVYRASPEHKPRQLNPGSSALILSPCSKVMLAPSSSIQRSNNRVRHSTFSYTVLTRHHVRNPPSWSFNLTRWWFFFWIPGRPGRSHPAELTSTKLCLAAICLNRFNLQGETTRRKFELSSPSSNLLSMVRRLDATSINWGASFNGLANRELTQQGNANTHPAIALQCRRISQCHPILILCGW